MYCSFTRIHFIDQVECVTCACACVRMCWLACMCVCACMTARACVSISDACASLRRTLRHQHTPTYSRSCGNTIYVACLNVPIDGLSTTFVIIIGGSADCFTKCTPFQYHFIAGSREQAFVTALASASLTQSIAKSCSLGVSTKCSCGRLPNTPPPGEFKWGGCGDDIRYGALFDRWFADGVFLKRKKKSKKVMMNLHNNRAGRKVSAMSSSSRKIHTHV